MSMNQIIERLLEGDYVYENGSLDFSCPKLEISLNKNEIYEGSFTVYGRGQEPTRGYIYAQDSRMKCYTDTLKGDQEVVGFSFDSTGMEEGEVVKGEIHVLSNQGEYHLPYVVNVEYVQVYSSLGHIKNLFHFANLAKTNWEEALHIYYDPIFERILNGNDAKYRTLYERLSKEPYNEQNMEEFLIAIHKKQQTDYIADRCVIELNEIEGVVEEHLIIRKNGWGYTRLHIETEGDFLSVKKDLLTEEDFSGNSCKISVFVDPATTHIGKNFGKIHFHNEYVSFDVWVILGMHTRSFQVASEMRNRNYSMVQIMELYQAFRLRKISSNTWMKETEKLVEGLLQVWKDDIELRLYDAQLLITEERYEEAQWILDQVLDSFSTKASRNTALWCYYLYLTTLIDKEEEYVNKVTMEVEQIYNANDHEWRIALLLLYLSEDFEKSFSRKWIFLEEQYKRGCISPIIYTEALLLLLQNPVLLMKLGPFEVQVLYFGARKESLSRELVEQVCYLLGKVKHYDSKILKVLQAGYEIYPDREFLTAICTMLMKGNRIDAEAAIWYEKAVEEEIRITRLYECYMQSIDLRSGVDIPKMVLMYFSYHCELGWERNAFLYAYVYKNQEKYPELFEAYRSQIDTFVKEQIYKMRINKDLAYLYKNVFDITRADQELINHMSELVFIHRVKVEGRPMKKAIVCYPQLEKEFVYALTNQMAYIPLYADEYLLVFADEKGARFTESVTYNTEKLLLPGKLGKELIPMVEDSLGFAFFVSQSPKERNRINGENIKHFELILKSSDVKDSYRKEIAMYLLQYYFEENDFEKLDQTLAHLKNHKLEDSERNKVITYCIRRELYDDAMWWVKTYGTRGIDAKVLMRLCAYRSDMLQGEFDEDTLELAMEVFHLGKYNEEVLSYLILNAVGLTKELRNIWNAALMFEMDTYSLSEKILLQTIFSGEYVAQKDDIFKAYVNKSAKREIELAYLIQCSMEYFVKDRIIDSFVIERIGRLYRFEGDIQKVCKLAYVKYYSENKEEINAANIDLLQKFLEEFLLQDIHLNCFRELYSIVNCMDPLVDKVLVEYHASPNSKAMIHYVIEREDGDDAEYCTEQMPEIYGGVCCMEFVLFFGESLQYYIMEQKDQKEQLTVSDTIQKSDISQGESGDKYNLINDIVISKTLQDYETTDNLLSEYIRKDFLTNELFTLF